MVRPGLTQEIDSVEIRLHGAIPTFKGYGGFPGSICASVNEQIVHGIPSPEVFLERGYSTTLERRLAAAGDNAWTFYVELR